MKPVRAAARALLSGIFVVSGARSMTNPQGLVPRAKPVTDRMAPALHRMSPRVPTDTATLVRLNGAMQLAGGLLLATGRLTRPAAAALAGTVVPTTLAGHPFWMEHDPQQRMQQRIQFLKNLGLLGGLLLAAADTQGRPGLRWRATRAVGAGGRSARRATRTAQRVTRTARRDARIAIRSASLGRRLAG